MAEKITRGKLHDLIQDDRNLNKGTERGQELIKKSLREFGAGRSLLLDKNNRIIAGNKTHANAEAVGIDDVIIVETDGTKMVAVKRTDVDLDTKQGREMALADNATGAANLEWNTAELESVADDFGIAPDDWDVSEMEQEETEEEIIERKRREFEERMAAGELDEDDPEYQEFLKKFEAKKTTDDCYTPPVVYEAVLRYVVETYQVNPKDVVRPFVPNGDYQREKYKRGAVVVDNPPFSILAEILQFYAKNGIKFFLFAPTLTLFSSSSLYCTALPVGVAVTYENGARVNTSFLTNLDPATTRLRSAPILYKYVAEADAKNRDELAKELPKYQYSDYIITATRASLFSKYGVEFVVPVSESEPISTLDSQRKFGKSIYGKGYIVSEGVMRDKKRAESERDENEKVFIKEEREKIPDVWELSDREREIVARLTQNGRRIG